MTRTPKILADGQLPSSKGTLYTVPASTSVYLSKITIFNTNITTQTVELYINPSGTSRQLIYITELEQYETIVYDGGVILETGDLLEGETTTVSVVDYLIMGVIET